MEFKAEITNKDIIDDRLVVQVRFRSEDGKRIVQDSYTTRGGQDADWLINNINRKLKELEELPAFVEAITLGEVELSKKDLIDERVKTPKEEYLEDYHNFSKLFDLYRKGIIEENNKKLVDLRKKLKDNLDFEYLDIK